ncbi:reverse transcriptase, partial [Phytophthora megakarya]
MDFVFGIPRDSRRKTGIVVFVDHFSKMVHLAAVAAEVTSVQTARLFVDMVFTHHGMPNDFVSDRDPRFTARFWQEFAINNAVHASTGHTPFFVKRGASLLAPRFIGPFTVAERHGNAYTLELPSDMRLHPTFY